MFRSARRSFVIAALSVASTLGAVCASEAPLPAIVLSDAGSGAQRLVTLGVPFGEGVVNPQEGLVVVDASGDVLETQWNPLSSWRTDDSVLHGALTFRVPAASGNGGTYRVERGTPASGTQVSKADILASAFEARVRVNIGGVTYELSARDLLDGTVAPRLDYTHFTGPLASEYVVGGPLRIDGDGTEHGHLQAYFYLRAFDRPVSRVYVTVVVENTGAFRTIQDVFASSVDVQVGGASLPGFPKSDLTLHADVRYPRRAWWGGDPSLWARVTGDYVSSTELMPTYHPVQVSESTLDGYPQEAEWNERRILSSSAIDSGGSKPELAPFDRWTAAFMVSGDRRAWNAMRTAVDEYGQMLSKYGVAVVHARDEETGFPLNLGEKDVRSGVWGSPGEPSYLPAERDTLSIAKTDLAHWPSIAYLTYLLSAESNELENVQHSAVQIWLNEAPGGGSGTIPNRSVRFLQVRGMAWSFREAVNGDVVTPDHHPLAQTLELAVGNLIQEYALAGRDITATDATGVWLVSPSATPYNGNTGFAPWMDDYLTWALGSAWARGWASELQSSGLWPWKAQAVVGRFATSPELGWCWNLASQYTITIRDTADSPFYDSWTEMFSKNYPGESACSIPGTDSIGTDRNATDYGAQIAPALTLAVETGVNGAESAWEIYRTRNFTWDLLTSAPEWAITPAEPPVRPMPPQSLQLQ